MEFKFNVNEVLKSPIVEINQNLIPPGFSGDRRALWDTVGKISEIVNAMGEASATAQGLTKPITTAERLRNSEHKLYFLIDQAANKGKGAVTGMLKVGTKGLYVFDRDGQHYQVSPPCILDFYVHESRQRTGLGKQLFEYMLQKEEIEPVKMAIDRPSEKLLGFLNKYYSLNTPVKQMNNYVVFDGFFPKTAEPNNIIEHDKSITPGKKDSANGLQSVTSPYGRYGAPRPPCSMGQIIHNQSSTVNKRQEATGVQSMPAVNHQNAYSRSPFPNSSISQSTPNINYGTRILNDATYQNYYNVENTNTSQFQNPGFAYNNQQMPNYYQGNNNLPQATPNNVVNNQYLMQQQPKQGYSNQNSPNNPEYNVASYQNDNNKQILQNYGQKTPQKLEYPQTHYPNQQAKEALQTHSENAQYSQLENKTHAIASQNYLQQPENIDVNINNETYNRNLYNQQHNQANNQTAQANMVHSNTFSSGDIQRQGNVTNNVYSNTGNNQQYLPNPSQYTMGNQHNAQVVTAQERISNMNFQNNAQQKNFPINPQYVFPHDARGDYMPMAQHIPEGNPTVQQTIQNIPSMQQIPPNIPREPRQIPQYNPATQQMSQNNPAVHQLLQNSPTLHQAPQNDSKMHQMSQNTSELHVPGSNPTTQQMSQNNPSFHQIPQMNTSVQQFSQYNPMLQQIPQNNPTMQQEPQYNPAVQSPQSNNAMQQMQPNNPVMQYTPNELQTSVMQHEGIRNISSAGGDTSAYKTASRINQNLVNEGQYVANMESLRNVPAYNVQNQVYRPPVENQLHASNRLQPNMQAYNAPNLPRSDTQIPRHVVPANSYSVPNMASRNAEQMNAPNVDYNVHAEGSNIKNDSGGLMHNAMQNPVNEQSNKGKPEMKYVEEGTLLYGYPPQFTNDVQEVVERFNSPKLERPRSLSIQQSEEQPEENASNDVNSEILEPPAELVDVQVKLEDTKIEEVDESGEPSKPADEQDTTPSGRKMPSHLTDQGYFDLKFYHNKLW